MLNSNKLKSSFPNFFLIDNVKVSNKEIIAERFNTFFANVGAKLASQLNSVNIPPFSSFLTESPSTIFSFNDITSEELKKIISAFKPKNTEDADGLSMKILKNISSKILPSLIICINQSLRTGIFPNALKVAKVIPLFKKDNQHLFDNYRPISLLPCISKIYEKIVYNQLYEYFDKNKLFSKHQHGFRKKHSTESAGLEFIGRVLSSIENNGIAFSLFIDLSKAFDTISHDILIKKLEFYGICQTPLRWFQSYLSDRKQFIYYDGINSSPSNINTGVPQGSILGPLLFLIYINDIINVSDKFNFVLYADPSKIQIVHKT
jgi:hypothetical protein